MTLEQIEYYVTSVESGSFSAAAERLFVSHSSVSRGVSALERELGVQLLIRGRRTLLCTSAGEAFYRRSRSLLMQARDLRDSMVEYQERKRLRVVSIGVYAPRFFELIREFQQTYPKVETIVGQEDQHAAMEHLLAGAVDLGLTFSFSLPSDSRIKTMVLEKGRFCALVSPSHELAGRDSLTSEELIARRDILGQNPFRVEWDRRRDQPNDLHSNLLQIRTGGGITVLPEHAAAEFGQGCVQIPIRGERTEYQLVLVWDRENRSRTLAEALSFFRGRLSGNE